MKSVWPVLIAAILASALTSFALNASYQNNAPRSVYVRVLDKGVIRCGYTPYSVGLMKDPNTGQLSGIYFDVVNELAANLGLKVEYTEEVGWGEQIEGLEVGRYDMICSPASLNSGRARAADFSIPLYYSPVEIWSRLGEAPAVIDDPSVKIATLDGEQTSVFARNFFPKATQVSLPQSTPFSDLLMQVTSGKADLVFAEPAAVEEFKAMNVAVLEKLRMDKPLVIVPNIFLMKSDEYAFKQMIDNGLREMFNTGRIDALIDKYEARPGLYVREGDRR